MDKREVAGVRRAIEWLHNRARQMNDHHAQSVLNSAAFSLGVDLNTWRSPYHTKPMDITERCRAQAHSMELEGWYVAANVLHAAAEEIELLRLTEKK